MKQGKKSERSVNEDDDDYKEERLVSAELQTEEKKEDDKKVISGGEVSPRKVSCNRLRTLLLRDNADFRTRICLDPQSCPRSRGSLWLRTTSSSSSKSRLVRCDHRA